MSCEDLPNIGQDAWLNIIGYLDLSAQINLSWVNWKFRELALRTGPAIYVHFGSRNILGIKENCLLDITQNYKQANCWEDYCIAANCIFEANSLVMCREKDCSGLDCIVFIKSREFNFDARQVIIFKSKKHKFIFYFKRFESNQYHWILDGQRLY